MMANASLTFSLVPAAAVAGEAKEVQSGDRMLLQAEGPERGINLLTKKLELRKEVSTRYTVLANCHSISKLRSSPRRRCLGSCPARPYSMRYGRQLERTLNHGKAT
jgi:hypothetical protein